MNIPHLLIIDDRKEFWLGIKMLAEALGIDATHENPDLVYQSWKDTMTPSLQELLKRINWEVIVLIDPDFLSGIQDEMDGYWIEQSQELLRYAKLVVLSGNREEEALNKIPEYSSTIDFFRQWLKIELPWIVKPLGIKELNEIFWRELSLDS